MEVWIDFLLPITYLVPDTIGINQHCCIGIFFIASIETSAKNVFSLSAEFSDCLLLNYVGGYRSTRTGCLSLELKVSSVQYCSSCFNLFIFLVIKVHILTAASSMYEYSGPLFSGPLRS